MNGGLRSIPLLYPAASFAAGIVLETSLPQHQWAIPCVFALIAALLLIFRWRYAAVLFLFATIGSSSLATRQTSAPDFTRLNPLCRVTGVVEEARESNSGSRLIVETSIPMRFKAIVGIRSAEALLHPGDTIVFNGVWKRPDAPLDVTNEFSIASYCFRNYITAICSADRFTIIGHSEQEPSIAQRARERIAVALKTAGLDNRAGALLEGVLLGESDAISAEMRESFSEAGLAHTLALSGTHLAVIASFLALVFFPLKLGGARRWAMIATIAAMWGYVWLTGAPASVVRAAIMASFVIVGRLLELPTSGFNSLCAAALIILIFAPTQLYSPGFQMSFLAVAGILMFSGKFTIKRLSNSILGMVNSWVAVCMSAVIGTAGVSTWLFHKFPLAFLLSNLPISFLLPAFMGGGILLVMLNLIGFKAGWLATVLNGLSTAITGIADAVNSLPWHQIEGLWFPGWILLFYYGALLLIYIAIEKRRILPAISGCIAMVTFLALSMICAPRPAARSIYRLSDPFCTAWVVFNEGKAWIISDVPQRHEEALRNRIGWRLREPLAIRGIDSIRIAPDTIRSQYFSRKGRFAVAGTTDIVFIDRATDVTCLTKRPKYAVVGGHYRHNIEAVATIVNPDTIILSPSLDFAVEQKFAERLDSLGYPYTKSEYRYWK